MLNLPVELVPFRGIPAQLAILLVECRLSVGLPVHIFNLPVEWPLFHRIPVHMPIFSEEWVFPCVPVHMAILPILDWVPFRDLPVPTPIISLK